MADKKKEIVCDLVEPIGVLSTSKKGWTKELNRVSWDGSDPKFDIRDWSPQRDKPTRGVTLTEDEARKVMELLIKWFEENDDVIEDVNACYCLNE